MVENLNIRIVNVNKELFSKYDDPKSLYPFGKQGHYNEKGYKLLSKTIFRKIKELEK